MPIPSQLACLLILKLASHAPDSGLSHLNLSNKVLPGPRVLLTQLFSPHHLLSLKVPFSGRPSLNSLPYTVPFFILSRALLTTTHKTHALLLLLLLFIPFPNCVPYGNVWGTKAGLLPFWFTPISQAAAVVLAYHTSSANIGLMNESVPTLKWKSKQTSSVEKILGEILKSSLAS